MRLQMLNLVLLYYYTVDLLVTVLPMTTVPVGEEYILYKGNPFEHVFIFLSINVS